MHIILEEATLAHRTFLQQMAQGTDHSSLEFGSRNLNMCIAKSPKTGEAMGFIYGHQSSENMDGQNVDVINVDGFYLLPQHDTLRSETTLVIEFKNRMRDTMGVTHFRTNPYEDPRSICYIARTIRPEFALAIEEGRVRPSAPPLLQPFAGTSAAELSAA